MRYKIIPSSLWTWLDYSTDPKFQVEDPNTGRKLQAFYSLFYTIAYFPYFIRKCLFIQLPRRLDKRTHAYLILFPRNVFLASLGPFRRQKLILYKEVIIDLITWKTNTQQEVCVTKSSLLRRKHSCSFGKLGHSFMRVLHSKTFSCFNVFLLLIYATLLLICLPYCVWLCICKYTMYMYIYTLYK